MSAFEILKHVPDPLLTGVALLREMEQPAARQAAFANLLASYPNAPSAPALSALANLARDMVSEDADCVDALPPSLSKLGNAAGCWVAAALLETGKRFDQAAAMLQAMPDADWGECRAMRLLARARNALALGDTQQAGTSLSAAIRCAESRRLLVLADRLLAHIGVSQARVRKRIALLGSGSLQFWAPVLRPVAFAAGIALDLYVGEFDQFRQEILGPSSRLTEFAPEIVILAPDWRSLGLPDESPDPEQAVAECISDLQVLWKKCAEQWGAAVVQHNFEIPEIDPSGRLSALLPGGRANVLRRINQELAKLEVAILDLDQIAALHGKSRWHDATQWLVARQYPHPDALPLLARHQTALLRALCGFTSKCAVLDLDGTLWGGVVGEDGLQGIVLGGTPQGEAYLAFQRYLLSLRARGILLAVCSKNNPQDALEVFRRHPEMLMKEEHFAVFLANWESKPDNLRTIAERLNLGLESLVFLDDNPAERARVRAELPQVEGPELPADPALYPTALHRTLLFESISLTGEDRRRAASYAENSQRESVQTQFQDEAGFLAALNMRIELRPFDLENLPRIVQLINKTNQFNLTTRRTTAAAVEKLIGDPAVYARFMRLRDRFGDSGITGVLVAHRENSRYRVDQWLLSCRVLGRKMEEVMITALLRHCVEMGVSEVLGEYIPTAKNGQVAGLYPAFGFVSQKSGLYVRAVDPVLPEYPSWLDPTGVE